MEYKAIVLSGRPLIREFFSARKINEFEFILLDRASNLPSIKDSVKPDILLLDEEVKGVEIKSLISPPKDQESFSSPLIVILNRYDSVAVERWQSIADDFVTLDQMSSPFFRKRLMTYAEKRRNRIKVQELERTVKSLEEKLREKSRCYEELILDLLDLRIPGLKERAIRSREVAEFICERIGLSGEEREELLFAALMHEIGKICLCERVLTSPEKGASKEMGPASKSHALIGGKLLSCMRMYKLVPKLVAEQYERFDGQGFPDGLRGNQMSKEALILQAVTFYEEQLAKGLKEDEMIEEVRFASGKVLEPFLSACLVQYIQERSVKACGSVCKIPVDELKPGMVIAEDVYSVSGTKILAKGAKVTEHVLALINERKRVDPIIGCAYVYRTDFE